MLPAGSLSFLLFSSLGDRLRGSQRSDHEAVLENEQAWVPIYPDGDCLVTTGRPAGQLAALRGPGIRHGMVNFSKLAFLRARLGGPQVADPHPCHVHSILPGSCGDFWPVKGTLECSRAQGQVRTCGPTPSRGPVPPQTR